MATKQADEFRLEEMLLRETVLEDERQNVSEVFERRASLEEKSRRVLVDFSRDVSSLGKKLVMVRGREWRVLLDSSHGGDVWHRL